MKKRQGDGQDASMVLVVLALGHLGLDVRVGQIDTEQYDAVAQDVHVVRVCREPSDDRACTDGGWFGGGIGLGLGLGLGPPRGGSRSYVALLSPSWQVADTTRTRLLASQQPHPLRSDKRLPPCTCNANLAPQKNQEKPVLMFITSRNPRLSRPTSEWRTKSRH